MRIVECVPNFSEGRDRAVIGQIAAAISGTEGCELLDVDPGKATHRTVVTFVGSPEAALEGAFNAIAKAAELIDMARHHGEHPRMGATDVCPFVPVAGVTMEECAQLARALGQRVGAELGIPVYLYEHAAASEERRNLATIRAGEYEGLPHKLADPRWRPDFGPATFNPRSGATVIGARQFLLAYNVNLNTCDRRLANDIALSIREAGRPQRDASGEIVRNADGTPVNVPGRLRAVKAVGWYIDEYKRAQISINLVDYPVTSLHQAFDAVCDEASLRGLRATGSELVGLTPLAPMLLAGRHYLRRQGKSAGAPEVDVIDCAIQSLGLREVAPFDPHEKIIEYRLRRGEKGLRHLTVTGFTDELSSESPAPGGGSVAALCGALAAGLAAMVANLTVGRKGQEDVWDELSDVAVQAQQHKDWLLAAVDDDTVAFNRVLEARRMPKKTPQETAARDAALREANRGATLVPLSVLERMSPVLDLVESVVAKGNPNSVSDGGVAALCAGACAEGAYYNVLINLGGLEGDAQWAAVTRPRAEQALERALQQARAVQVRVRAALGADLARTPNGR
jgi:glutamate formiminotransferase/formiminotetrahydrofolate cyclodeaminase